MEHNKRLHTRARIFINLLRFVYFSESIMVRLENPGMFVFTPVFHRNKQPDVTRKADAR